MRFPAYEYYTFSESHDLGEIPSHWDAKPLKRIAGIDSSGCYGIDEEEGDIGLPVATTAQIDAHGRFVVGEMPRRGFTQDEVDRYSCQDGDILVVKSSGSATNIISGKAGLVNEDTHLFIFSNFLMRIRPDRTEVLPSFVYAVLRSHLTRQRVEQMCATTTYPNLQVPEYSSALIPVPPLDEQKAIASFLDAETSKIDGLVSEQRRLIELLKEKRQAVISHAVTKGLNPDAKMKPSGIQWPIDVPVTWEVVQLRRHIELQRGVDITKDEQVEGEVPVVSSGGISSYHNEVIVTGPGVVLGRKGSVGSVHYIEKDYWPHDTTLYVKEFRGNLPRFVYYKMCSMELASYDTGSSNPTLNRNTLHPVKVPWPPVEEQRDIVDQLDKVFDEFNQLQAEAERAIELLQERRTALISAAVTGKIDVRGFADKETVA